MKVRTLLEWGIALALAGALLFMVGIPKLIGSGPNPIFAIIAGRSGISLFEPFVRYATGLGEIIAAILLILPFTRRIGAILTTVIVSGALAFHASPWLGVHIPNLSMVHEELQAGKTIAQIDAMNLPSDGGALFVTALVFLAAAIAVFALSSRLQGGAHQPAAVGQKPD